jgi:hypothetical protein
MHDLRLEYGRLDFMQETGGNYWFCEVNPNGQFAWLDPSGDLGLLQAIEEIVYPSSNDGRLRY